MKIFFLCLSLSLLVNFYRVSADKVVNCLASTSLPVGYSQVFSISSSTNATASYNDYPLKIYCNNFPGSIVGTILASTTGCTAGFFPLFGMSSSSFTNLHVEDPSVGSYAKVACFGDYINQWSYATVTTKLNNCNGYGTTLFSAESKFNVGGNAHLGDANAYPLKRCLTLIRTQSLSVILSSVSAGFGTLNSATTTYATSDGVGTTTPLTATSSSFYIDVDVNGNYNYTVYLQGGTLINQQNTTVSIPKIGSTPIAFVPGTEMFGVSAVADCLSSGGCNNGASSTIAYPYNQTAYAYDGDTATSTVLANGVSDDTTAFIYRGTRYYVKLGATIAPLTPAGKYDTSLTLVVAPEF